MGLFGKIFGRRATLDQLRKAVEQKRFAEARIIAQELMAGELAEADKEEIIKLERTAGDELARLNLEEAKGFVRSGQYEQAQEHFQLALDLVVSETLKQDIEAARIVQPETVESGSAGQYPPVVEEPLPGVDDADQQMELILTSYPENLRSRYLDKGSVFKQAFLLTHSGDDQQAFDAWQLLEAAEQDDIYWFELGALLGRSGQLAEAQSALEKAVSFNPEMPLAIEAMVTVLLQQEKDEEAENLLRQLLDRGTNPRFCHTQLTSLYAQRGDLEKAAAEADFGLAAQNGDPRFLQLAAAVFEKTGQLDKAEEALEKLPVSGCGGGVSLPLAEFWLRQKRELGRILDVFNAACRENPDNPRWQLRVAQTYLARNWNKDALKLFKKVVDDPRLEPDLADEARKQLNSLKEQ